MRYKIFGGAASLAFCMTAFCGISVAGTISDSVSAALKTHPALIAKVADSAAARESVRESKSGFFPTLSANARTGRVHADDDTTRAATGGADQSWLGEGTLTLSQQIFDGFGTWSRYQAAKEREAVAGMSFENEAEDLALRAVRSHLNVMRTREMMSAVDQYTTHISKDKESIALLVKEGATDEAELLQADEILMVADTTRLGYEEVLRRAEADFVESVGQLPEDVLKLGDLNIDGFLPKTAEEAITLAAVQHPQVKAAGLQAEAFTDDASAEQAQIMPRLDAELSWMERDQNDNLGGEATNGQAMLRLTWGLSTGGAEMARAARSLKQRDSALATKQDVLRGLERDIRQKYASLDVSERQLAILGEREKANEKIFENYSAQFEGGNRSILQLISAQSRLFEAKTARIDAYYRRQLARFEVLQAIGGLRNALGVVETAQIAR